MLVIVRHGNTFENGTPLRRIGAGTDLPLTEEGRHQARALGAHFTGLAVRFDRVLVSPLTRTRQTAQAILDAQETPPEPRTAEFLREIDYGPDENRLESDVLDRIGRDALDAWDKRAQAPEGWVVDAAERIAAWAKVLADANLSTANTLLVTSNGAARFVLMADPALERASKRLDSLKLPTGGYGTIDSGARGEPELLAWGIRP